MGTNWTIVGPLLALILVIGAAIVIPTIYTHLKKTEEEKTARQKSQTHRELATLALGNQKTALGDGDDSGDNVPMDVTVFESGTVIASTRRRRAAPPSPQIHAVVPPVQALVVSAPGQVSVIPIGQVAVQAGDGARRQAEADARREPAPPAPAAPAPPAPAPPAPAPRVNPNQPAAAAT